MVRDSYILRTCSFQKWTVNGFYENRNSDGLVSGKICDKS